MNELDLVRNLALDPPDPSPAELARGRAQLLAAIEGPPARRRAPIRLGRRHPLDRRSALGVAVGLAVALAAVLAGGGGLPGGGPIATAQAFPVFATPTISNREIANSILGSFLKSDGVGPRNPVAPGASAPPPGPDAPYYTDAVRHAHAFATYWGTAYTFMRHDTKGYSVCAIYPDYQTKIVPWHGGWVGGCATGPTLATAARGWETISDPHGVEFVQLVPAGTSAVLARAGESARPVTITDGVLCVRVTAPAELTVRRNGTSHTYHLRPGESGATSA